MVTRACLFAAVLLLLIALPITLAAQTVVTAPETSPEANELFRHVMSPYCPELMLVDCPSPDAAVLRDQIKARLAKGERPKDIEDELVREYGETFRTMPAARGFGLFAWLVPIAVVSITTPLAILTLRRSRQRHAAGAHSPDIPMPQDLLDRLEEELIELG
jgi:cytochrome c-type biogenesis protein CcmH/NrfF